MEPTATAAAPTETPEQKAAREAQQREMANQGQSSDGGIMGAIMGFLKFLFDMFLPSTNAPNEDPADIPESPADKARIGKLIIDKKAIPKWESYQASHHGEAVHFVNPVKGAAEVTSGFGHREAPTAGASHEHAGVDIAPRDGQRNPDVVASASGVVLFSGKKQGYGNTVIIGHADGSYTLYGHMHGEKMPEIGSEVRQGDAIGVMGATGTATGIHLHYEQRVGEQAVQPQIDGVKLAKGVAIPSGDHPSRALASLVNPKDHSKLPVSQAAGSPSAPLAFAAATTNLGGIRLFS